jgi:hypothetical protein
VTGQDSDGNPGKATPWLADIAPVIQIFSPREVTGLLRSELPIATELEVPPTARRR